MISYFIQSGLILTLFYVVYRFLFVRFTFFQQNRFFLLGGIFSSLFLPFIPLNFAPEKTEYIYLSRLPLGVDSLGNSSPSGWFIISTWDWRDWAFGIYLMGVILFCILFCVQLIQIIRILRNGKRTKKEGLNLVFTDKPVSPFSFFSFIVFNPKLVSESQMKHVLTHEKIHIRQGHQIDVMLAEFLKIFFWFNPISWLYGKEIRTNLEFIADNRSLRLGVDKKSYLLSLVTICQQSSDSRLVNNFSKKLIQHRIKMLNKMKTNHQILIVYFLILPVLFLASIALSAQIQSQNPKIKQVIVITEDGVEKSQVEVRLKNEKGESAVVDSALVQVIPGDLSHYQSEAIRLNENEGLITNPGIIERVDVSTQNGKNTVIITYKNHLPNDTIEIPDVNSIPRTEFTPKVIYKGQILDLTKDLSDLEGLHIELDSLRNVLKTIRIHNGKAIQNLKNSNIIQIEKNKPEFEGNQVIYWHRDEKSQSYKIPKISIKDGNEPLIVINGKKSSMEELKKMEGQPDVEILYVESDELVIQFGDEAKRGVLVGKPIGIPLRNSLGLESKEQGR